MLASLSLLGDAADQLVVVLRSLLWQPPNNVYICKVRSWS